MAEYRFNRQNTRARMGVRITLLATAVVLATRMSTVDAAQFGASQDV
jgi:hypothetical protein